MLHPACLERKANGTFEDYGTDYSQQMTEYLSSALQIDLMPSTPQSSGACLNDSLYNFRTTSSG